MRISHSGYGARIRCGYRRRVVKRFSVIPAFQKTLGAYEDFSKDFCKANELAQTEFDILMFLENYPEYSTAKDIIKKTGMKANLVSIYVIRLAKRGFLEREPVKGNRRCIRLTITEKAKRVTAEGLELQKKFSERFFAGVSPEDAATFRAVVTQCARNLEEMKNTNREG